MAYEKFKNKEYQYAIVLIDKAIALDPENIWLIINKSEFVYKLNGTNSAINTLVTLMHIEI